MERKKITVFQYAINESKDACWFYMKLFGADSILKMIKFRKAGCKGH